MLNTFQLVYQDRTLSPILVTTREYGKWMTQEYDNYTAAQELFTKAKTKDGNTVLESHPGTKIGRYFDSNVFSKPELQCWMIRQDSAIMKRLVKLGLADWKDTIPSLNNNGSRVLRVYTLQQVEIYLKTMVDRNFDWNGKYLQPKQIKVTYLSDLIMPKVENRRKSLF